MFLAVSIGKPGFLGGVRVLVAGRQQSVAVGAKDRLQGCAVVLTNYGPSRRLKGVLGVIGPTRMAYSQTVARLRTVAQAASVRMAEA